MIHLSLQPEAEERIDRQLASGNFDTKEQVAETALVLLDRERPLRNGDPPRGRELIAYTRGDIVSLGSPLAEGFPIAHEQTRTIQGVATEGRQLDLIGEDTEGTGAAAEASQSWLASKREVLTDAQAHEKDSLLAAIADSRLGTMEQRVAFILHRYPGRVAQVPQNLGPRLDRLLVAPQSLPHLPLRGRWATQPRRVVGCSALLGGTLTFCRFASQKMGAEGAEPPRRG